jgi:hypothetical protein
VRVTGPGQPVHLLLDIADLLNELRIPYAVVGALAVSFHGMPRATNDADALIWLKGTGKSENDLTIFLEGAGYRIQSKSGGLGDPLSGVVVVEDSHENRVDLLLGISGLTPEASGRVSTTSLLGATIRVVGAEDLVAMKIFAGGPQDLEDVKGIFQVSGDRLDFGLLRHVADGFGSDVARQLSEILETIKLGGNS